MNLLVLFLITIPACLAQFSIQGPSDGNRVAQGLRIEEGKGIEYTDQNDSDDSGFSITGATDGSAQIQGASDSHSNFQIHGATRGPAERYVQGPTAGSYNIQGSTDGQGQSIIQGSYDSNLGPAKSLQYDDPSGLRVNWRSYDRRAQPKARQEAQYSETSIASVPRSSSRQKSQASKRPPPPPEPIQQSKPLENAPSHIQHLLQLQAQLPYVNIVPEPFRYENLIASQGNQQPRYEPQYEPEPQEEAAPEPRRPTYRGKSRGSPRHRRQAPHYRQEAAPVQRQQPRRLSQPSADPPINYNSNLPPHLQQLLKYQAQTPYINSIPEQYRFNPEPAIQMQLEQVRRHYQDLLRQQPASPTVHTIPPVVAPAPKQIRGPPPQGRPSAPSHPRQRRQAPHQPQRHLRPQSLPAEPVPRYSTNIPSSIRSILQFQAQIPYNIIANQVEYKFDKTYVPQPAQAAGPPQVQYQGQNQYQGQRQYREQNQYQDQNQYQSEIQSVDEYQGQPSGYSQTYASQSQYLQYPQYQAEYGEQQAEQEVRPVTEN